MKTAGKPTEAASRLAPSPALSVNIDIDPLVEAVRRHVKLTPQASRRIKGEFAQLFQHPAIVSDWAPIDDRVMGGISRSRLRHDPAGHAPFEGTVSLERNGGFASVRSRPAARGLPGAATCVIEIRGDHKQFKLSLLTDDGFDSLNYQASFTPSGIDWQTLRLPLATFRASLRGREVPGATALDPARIRQVGLMIAARQAGPFALRIKGISLAWSARASRGAKPGAATRPAQVPDRTPSWQGC